MRHWAGDYGTKWIYGGRSGDALTHLKDEKRFQFKKVDFIIFKISKKKNSVLNFFHQNQIIDLHMQPIDIIFASKMGDTQKNVMFLIVKSIQERIK
jgi:hypothetical protein